MNKNKNQPTIIANLAGSIGLPENTTSIFSITSIGEFIGALLVLAYYIGGVLVFVYIVLGGFQWILSGGNKEKIDAAKEKIKAALIGMTIVATSWAIVRLLQAFYGINVIELNLPLPY